MGEGGEVLVLKMDVIGLELLDVKLVSLLLLTCIAPETPALHLILFVLCGQYVELFRVRVTKKIFPASRVSKSIELNNLSVILLFFFILKSEIRFTKYKFTL